MAPQAAVEPSTRTGELPNYQGDILQNIDIDQLPYFASLSYGTSNNRLFPRNLRCDAFCDAHLCLMNCASRTRHALASRKYFNC